MKRNFVTIGCLALLVSCQSSPLAGRPSYPSTASTVSIHDARGLSVLTHAEDLHPSESRLMRLELTAQGTEKPDVSEGQTKEEVEGDPEKKKERISQPLIVPIISSDPKIATAGGAMLAYVHQFDDVSPSSLFGAAGAYSTTDSYYYGLFARAFFGEDHHRLTVAAIQGVIRNDYDDFLGTGLPAQTTDDIALYGLRYLHKISGPWFLGAQGVYTNYVITGENALSQGILDLAGLTGVDAAGIGLVGKYDTKDNQNSPLNGLAIEVNNLAFREALGSDADFDSIRAEAQLYLPWGRANTTAMQIKGRWTNDAPPSAFSSVDLRGYVQGQYLAENSTLIEVDERIMLNEKWGVAGFAGLAVLYGSGSKDQLEDNLFPNIGIGAFYQLTEDRMVVRADIAFGKEGNWAFYLKFNQPF